MRARSSSSLHGHIQLLAGDLVVITQRVVRIVQESARDRQTRALQRPLVEKLNEGACARDFGDNVARARGQALITQRGRGLVQVLNVHELVHAQDARRLLTVRAARAVLAVCQRMLGARVDNEKLQADRAQVEGNLARRHVAAVEGQRMALAAAQGRCLVQAARVRARHLVFRGACRIHEHLASLVVGGLDRARQTQRAHLIEGHRRRALKRGARRQATTQGHARPQSRIKTGQRPVSSLLKGPRDAREIRGPMVRHLTGGPLRADHVEIEDVGRLAGLWRNQANRPILARRQRHVRAVRQSNRNARATVVVHVLADDIDASGRAPHAPRLVAKRVTEQV